MDACLSFLHPSCRGGAIKQLEMVAGSARGLEEVEEPNKTDKIHDEIDAEKIVLATAQEGGGGRAQHK